MKGSGKQSSLLGYGDNYGRKKFYSTGPCFSFEKGNKQRRGVRKLTGENLKVVWLSKLGCFVMCTIVWPIQARSSLELKTQNRFRPVRLSLSMTEVIP